LTEQFIASADAPASDAYQRLISMLDAAVRSGAVRGDRVEVWMGDTPDQPKAVAREDAFIHLESR
jgi:hypothetical protein